MSGVAITGGFGFLGWHTACRLRALYGTSPIRVGRAEFSEPERLDAALADCDQVIHLAAVNRADSDEEVLTANAWITERLTGALERADRPVAVVNANSIQADMDSSYGRAKAAAAGAIREVTRRVGGTYSDVVLPNLFGEHGRPAYNSFVATFAHEIACGRQPTVTEDRQVPLLHAQDAAQALIHGLSQEEDQRPVGELRGVVEVLDQLNAIHALYAARGEIPPLNTAFELNLFNTYRAAAWPAMFPRPSAVHADDRGELFEAVRAHGGTGQSFVSTTRLGRARGEHYHLHKVERFFVLRGEAEISLRRLLYDDVVTFRLSGDAPSFVDMPTLWVHNIRNVGSTELITMFWADQLLDCDHPDQYPEQVEVPR